MHKIFAGLMIMLVVVLVGQTYIPQKQITQQGEVLQAQTSGVPDWPMAGHDNQRTAWAEESLGGPANKPKWFKKIDPYIPSRAHLVTYLGSGSRPDLVLVPTAKGVYALNANDGNQYWFYATSMPVGHSPTIVSDVVYISVHDKTIHAVNVNTGAKIWQTAQAGAGFDTSPLVANNRVYAGNRDSYFYAFNTSNGSLSWYFKTGGPISYSAAISADNQSIYFASNDSHAYSLNASTGSLVWKSAKLPGDGFYTFWPVINSGKVLFAGTTNYEKLERFQHTEAFGTSPTDGELVGPTGSDGYMDAARFTNYLKANPTKRTFFILDSLTGTEDTNYAPILWMGNWSGNRQPPVIGPNGIVYLQTVWKYQINFLLGRIVAWPMGTSKLKAYPNTSDTDAQDENAAISIIGNDIYYNHKEDQYGKIMPLSGGTNSFWSLASNLTNFPNYATGWENRKYGNVSNNGFGTHGNVNPPVPLRDKVFFHISNSIVVFGI